MNKNILLTALIITLILISGCTQQPAKPLEKGFLEGKITIGPICPVERFPPDPNCEPKEETYTAWQIAIWTSDERKKVAQIQPDLNGTYKLELPVGTYVVDFEKEQHFGGNNLPATIAIDSGKTTVLNIDIDTGIR